MSDIPAQRHIDSIVKTIRGLAGKYDTWIIFNDYIEMTAICIRNSVNNIDWQEKEDRYLEIIKKYTRPEMDMFAKIIGELTTGLEKEPCDMLGMVFMLLELGDKWKGQFFTPQNIANMMAELTLGKDIEAKIEEDGFVTVNDCSVGGGSTIIGFANALTKKKYNRQTEMAVICNDVDIKSVYMCYIQLSLLGIPAQVIHMDTITNKPWGYWNTPFYELGGWSSKIGDKHRALKHLVDKAIDMEVPEEKKEQVVEEVQEDEIEGQMSLV